jgi:23S rRNA (guanosine2251-2'-O)-methyltransferase
MESKQPYTGPKRPSESTFVFGIHPVNEALDAGKDIESVIVIRSSQNERLNKLLGRVRAVGVPIKMVPREKLNALTLKNHQGIVAMLSPITYQPLEEIVLGAFERGEAPILIAADGITDVRNLGAIARSAECFGAHALIVPERGSAAINDGAIKSSSGALLRLPVCRVSKISTSLEYLKQSGITCIALSEKSAEDIHTSKLEAPFCLALGDEGFGVSTDVIEQCDHRLKIPMDGNTASLNVSVAAGIALYALKASKG